MEKMKFSLDRVEGDVAVCYTETADPVRYELPLGDYPVLRGVPDGTLFEATVDASGTLCELRLLADETTAQRERMNARMQALLRARGKKS